MRHAARARQLPIRSLTEPLIADVSVTVQQMIGELLHAVGAQMQMLENIDYPAACRLLLVAPDVHMEGESVRDCVVAAIEAILGEIRAYCYDLPLEP